MVVTTSRERFLCDFQAVLLLSIAAADVVVVPVPNMAAVAAVAADDAALVADGAESWAATAGTENFAAAAGNCVAEEESNDSGNIPAADDSAQCLGRHIPCVFPFVP